MAKEMNNDCQSCNGIWSNESKHFIMKEYDLFAMVSLILCSASTSMPAHGKWMC